MIHLPRSVERSAAKCVTIRCTGWPLAARSGEQSKVKAEVLRTPARQ